MSSTAPRRAAATTALLAVAVASPARAVTYTAANTIDLNPATLLGANSSSMANGGAGTQQAGYGLGANTGNASHAMIWTDTSGSALDIHPSGLLGTGSSSIINGATGVQQAGYGWGPNTGSANHALVWFGTAASAVDLHPAALLGTGSNSLAWGAGGNQQVGFGYGPNTSNANHALLWTGTAGSVVDLHPGFLGSSANSTAYGTSGTQQVGYGYGSATSNASHALLWSGTAASAVDLHPAALLGASSNSMAEAAAGGQQVGFGYGPNTGTNTHALLWSGTAASAVDLNPASLLGTLSTSYALATTGAQQAGYGYGPNTGNNAHALVWSGSAASVVDLHGLLPAGFTSSQARSVDVYGNVAGYANIGSVSHAIAWLAGDTYNVASGSSSWGTPANWTSGVPAGGGDVLLIQQDATNRTVTYTSAATVTPLGNVTIDATGSGTLTVNQTGGTLSSTSETVGLVGGGAVTQSAGTHLVASTLTLAGRAGASASYTLSGSGVLNAHAVVVNAGATFTQNGGTLVTGSFAQNGGTVAGTVANTGTFTYNAGAFTGRLVNSGTVALLAAFTAGNGIENDGDLHIDLSTPATVNGAGLDNFGTLTLDGGLLAGSGPVTNDVGGVMTARGTVGPSFTNYGRLSTSGLLVLSAASSNGGTVTLAPGQSLRANAPFTNSGPISLNGGSISGSAAVTNVPGGSITGAGGVSSPLVNSGGLIQTGTGATLFLSNLANNSAGGGLVVGAGSQMTVANAFPSSGFIQLLGPNALLSGGAITNSGTIKGAGQVANAIVNNGVIRAETGELDLSGVVTNPPAGQIQADVGTALFIAQGLAANAGTIVLAGGTIDTNNQPLSNAGAVNGHGTLRTGTLTNGGSLFLANGDSALYGPLVNNAGAAVRLASAAVTFYRPVTNNGTFSLTAATATFSGGFAGTAPSDPAGIMVGAQDSALGAQSLSVAGTLGLDAASSLLASDIRQDSVTSAGAIAVRPIAEGGDTSAVNTLTLSPGSSFDLADTKLVLSSAGTPAATLRGYLFARRLFSSTADADPQHRLAFGYVDNALLGASTWGGLAVDASNLLVKLTYLGDANLDGRITADDYALLDRGFSKHLSAWSDGDFNYDGQVTSADYLLIDRVYAQQGGQLSPAFLSQRESEFGPDYVAALMTAVPEPSSLIGCGVVAIATAARHRRR